MISKNKPLVIFHIIEIRDNPIQSFNIMFEFDKQAKNIEINKPYEINEIYFPKLKDKFMTHIILNIDEQKMKFLITLYYGINHLTIIKNKIKGTCYEIINQISSNDKKEQLLDKINFEYNKIQYSVSGYDTIENSYRRRFMIINSPIKIDLDIKHFEKIKENLSYKISIFPSKELIVQEIKSYENNVKISIPSDELVSLNEKFNEVFNNNSKTDIEKFNSTLNKYEKYFIQDLINKEDYTWDLVEFSAFCNYYKYQLLLYSKKYKDCKQVEYYIKAMKILSVKYQELCNIFNINCFEKIRTIVSLYYGIISDFKNSENKSNNIGEYTLLNIASNNHLCYEYALEFVLNIINNLKEDSFIFFPILQMNSGYSKNLNSDEEFDIFQLSMLNIEMIKKHLLYLMRKLIIKVRHPDIKSKRGFLMGSTGVIFIYEDSIFRNNMGYTVPKIMIEHPKDAAINIGITILHEIFMHNKIRSSINLIPGIKTPCKFFNAKFDITNFYYTNIKNSLDCLAIYTDDNNLLGSIPKKGESDRILEYFFENNNKHIINFLKSYLGYGELLSKTELFTKNNLDELQSLIYNKYLNKSVSRLYDYKLKIKHRRDELNESENDENNSVLSEEQEEISENMKEILEKVIE